MSVTVIVMVAPPAGDASRLRHTHDTHTRLNPAQHSIWRPAQLHLLVV